MTPPKLTIAVLCSVALAAMVGVTVWEAARQERNGRAGLRDRAVRFSEALEEAAHLNRIASLLPWLEESERRAPAALPALDVLAVAPRRRLSLVLARVLLGKDERHGHAEYLLTSPEGARHAGTILVDWVRAPDGTWFVDLVGS